MRPIRRRRCRRDGGAPTDFSIPSAFDQTRSDIEISYEQTREVDREGWFGDAARWLADHALLGGLIGGLIVVAIATVAAPGAITAAPFQVALLSAFVVAAWVVLFYLMSDFFRRQATRTVSETRRIEADGERFVAERAGETEVEIDDPEYRIYLPPDVTPDEGRPGDATRVWLVVRGGDAAHVVETKVTVEEAVQYPTAEGIKSADRELPIHLASGLLELADRAGT